ncbi:MAG: hypothetical protein HUU02_08655 [Bacteroidetes bacterium]|nr:hypothetical protein [Bacteroidota bacterium]
MPNEKTIHCRRSPFPSIDLMDDADIDHFVTADHLLMVDGTEPPSTIDTQVGIEWNENGFIVCFRGRFNTLRLAPPVEPSPHQGKTYHLWELSDVYEVFMGVDAARTLRYKEFQVSPDARWIDIDVDKNLGISNHHWYSGLQCRSVVDQEMKIWSSVIELPWNCFGQHRRTEDHWNINLYRATGAFHGDELLAWSPTGTGPKCFHRPEHFGTIIFEP